MIKIVLAVVIFILGIFIGIVWKDLPLVTFNPEIKLYEVLNFLLTLTIGISIPFLVKKWIEDNRSVKNCLVDEIKNIIESLNNIKNLINNCHSKLEITKEEKDEINYLFHNSELQINSLSEQLKVSFKSKSENILTQLKTKYHSYKDFLTGGELMLSTFNSIDDRYYREHNTEQAKIETYLKTVIHQIHKL